jgi:hypothetical protein
MTTVRMGWLGLMTLTVALAQNPPGPGLRRGFGPPPNEGFGGPRFLGAEPGMPGRVVKGAPFSADVITESTQTLPDGNHIKQSGTVHFTRDSEGRTRREQSLTSLGALGSNRTVVFIDDPVNSVSYALMPDTKTANKSVRPAGRGGNRAQSDANSPRPEIAPKGAGPGGRGPRNSQNVKTESLGTQTMEGVQVQGTRMTMTIPAGQIGNEQPINIVTERWYSADLQTTIMVKHSDPRNGDTVTHYTNITRAEPVPTLFQPPADYKVNETRMGRFGGNLH